jgi:hypothetical protein
MTRGGKTLVCGLSSLLACAGLLAATPGTPANAGADTDADAEAGDAAAPAEPEAPRHPYSAISERNVFALKPPPPPPEPPSEKAPALKITLTGITTILGNKRALLETPAEPAKPGQPAKGKQFYMLTEGQRDGDLEVLQIDEVAGTVKVRNSDITETLSFEKNGNKPMTAPAVAGQPGVIPPPIGGMSPIPAPPSATPTIPGVSGGGLRPLPTRTIRGPRSGTSSSTSPASPTTTASLSTSGTASAPTVIGGAPAVHVSPSPTQASPSQPIVLRSWPPEGNLTAEEQALLHAAEVEMRKNNPNLPPLPPTPFTPTPGAPAETTQNTTPQPGPMLPPPGPMLPPRIRP